MKKEKLTQIIDYIAEGKDTTELLSDAITAKTRTFLGLTENNDVRIKGDDVFVGNTKVGSFTAEGDQIEFTDTEGNSKKFDNDEEMIGYITGVNESADSGGPKVSEKRKKERLDKVHNRPHDTDSKIGDYVKHELSNHHKDSRMDNPSDHDHGHDDPSGKTLETKGSKSGELPPDKEKVSGKHSASSEYKDHGHDDPDATKDIEGNKSSGANPPDKEKDLKNSEHEAEVDSTPHGHDSPTATRDITKGK